MILHATGVSISTTGALAVETFSRVASFASSFIPANLGALEASSLAAAAAVGASGGGAALALARRLRGLFWAGLGLAIYPRGVRPSQPAAPGTPQVPATRSGATLLDFPEGAGQEIWRLSFTATRSAMPYGIFAFALANRLPGIIVLAAIGNHVYWISLVVKLKALMGHEDALAA